MKIRQSVFLTALALAVSVSSTAVQADTHKAQSFVATATAELVESAMQSTRDELNQKVSYEILMASFRVAPVQVEASSEYVATTAIKDIDNNEG